MSNFFIALLVAVCGSVWLYSKFFSRRTGADNTKPAIIGTAVTGFIIFIVVLGLLSFIN